MKLWTAILAVAVAISMAGLAEARGNKAGKAAKADVVKGKIVSVQGTSIVIKQKAKAGGKGTVTVATDSKTKVKGAATSVADLKAGEKVKARVKNGVAKSIEVKAAGGKNAKNAGMRGGRTAGKRGSRKAGK